MAELTKEARMLLRQGKALRVLSEMEEWKVFLELISSQCDNWGTLAVAQSKSVDEMVEKEYHKGVLFGLRLAASLPSATYEQRLALMRDNPDDPEIQAESQVEVGPVTLQKAP